MLVILSGLVRLVVFILVTWFTVLYCASKLIEQKVKEVLEKERK